MKFNILGLNILKYYDAQEEMNSPKHILYIQDINSTRKFAITLDTISTMCGSGYTTATEGEFEFEQISSFPGMQFRYSNTKEVFDKELNHDIFNIMLKSPENSTIFNVQFDGGDSCYPHGSHYVNMKHFLSNGRDVTDEDSIKRKVWIFKGDSILGKTFISDHCSLESYETDSDEKLPRILWQDIIVIGNKYDFSIEEVKKHIPCHDDTEIITVNFTI